MNFLKTSFLFLIPLLFFNDGICISKAAKKKKASQQKTYSDEMVYPGTLPLDICLKYIGLEKLLCKNILNGKKASQQKLPQELPTYYLAIENLITIYKKNSSALLDNSSYPYNQMFVYIAFKKKIDPLRLLKFAQQLMIPDDIIKVIDHVKNDAHIVKYGNKNTPNETDNDNKEQDLILGNEESEDYKGYADDALDSLQNNWLSRRSVQNKTKHLYL